MADRTCPDCEPSVDRRGFLATAAAVAGGVPLFATAKVAAAPPTKTSAPETAVKALYDISELKPDLVVLRPTLPMRRHIGSSRERAAAKSACH